MSEACLTLGEWPFTVPPVALMQRLGGLPLAHQPGERWLYHTGAEILGVLIARLSGQSLATFLHERIFAPLGKKDTGFYVPAAKLDRIPPCYGRDYSAARSSSCTRGAAATLRARPSSSLAAAGSSRPSMTSWPLAR
jgi:CubicO group peptidase (beta-lactamase class C family)